MEQRFRRQREEEDGELEEDETDEGWFEWWHDYIMVGENHLRQKTMIRRDQKYSRELERYYGTARLLVYVHVHYLEILT